jgi:methylated-DNA-[protein]-cysteine S-methyltransferase
MPLPTLYQTQIASPLGAVLLAAADTGLAGVWFVHDQAHLPDHSGWQTHHQHPMLLTTAEQLTAYFNGQRQAFDLNLATCWGTPFQRRVWQALMQIPYGKTTHYGLIARAIGNPKAVRAVGAAIGRNPHSIVVPCHRVLGAQGALTGYAGGLSRKHFLLQHESSHT